MTSLRTMCENGFEWARQRGKLRRNEIHGEEEADLPFLSEWEKSVESGNRVAFKRRFTMADTLRTAHIYIYIYVYFCIRTQLIHD